MPTWGQPTRIAFRISAVYLSLYLLLNGNLTLLLLVPVIGFMLQSGVSYPTNQLSVWVGRHVFHLTGIAARWHASGSGDAALDYVRIFCLAVLALIGGAVWTALDWRRPRYDLFMAWLRFLLRLSLGLAMLGYGFAKVFPLQMREPSFAILNNTYGNSSPMTLLWTMIGLHPSYEVVCGLAEVLAGALILFRRTAAFGTLVCAVVVTNIFLFNLFFDVPVKIYSGHLLIFCIFVLIPDLTAFGRFFWLHESAQLCSAWVPPASRRGFRIATVIVEVAALLGAGVMLIIFQHRGWSQREAAQKPIPIMGAWQIDAVSADDPAAKPASPDGDPWTVLYIDDRIEGFYRTTEGSLWRCGFQYDDKNQTLGVSAVEFHADYHWSLSDPDHLSLSGKVDGNAIDIMLHRLPPPPHYPLLERSFHWVNEWTYER